MPPRERVRVLLYQSICFALESLSRRASASKHEKNCSQIIEVFSYKVYVAHDLRSASLFITLLGHPCRSSMRKIIVFALASFLWKKFKSGALVSSRQRHR